MYETRQIHSLYIKIMWFNLAKDFNSCQRSSRYKKKYNLSENSQGYAASYTITGYNIRLINRNPIRFSLALRMISTIIIARFIATIIADVIIIILTPIKTLCSYDLNTEMNSDDLYRNNSIYFIR